MAQFKAINDKVKVNGQTVLSVVAGMPEFKEMAVEILAANGIPDPRPDQWYPQQSWLNAFKEIAEKVGPFTLNEIGKSIPEHAAWPPQVNSVESALGSIDIAYHMNHAIDNQPLFNGQTGSMAEGIGHYTFQKTGDRSAKMICANPYPCDFDRGIIESAANKFKAAGTRVTVKKDASADCRTKGGEACTFLVSW